MKKIYKIMSMILCLGAGILLFAVGNNMQADAYRSDYFEEDMERAQQYENNIILDALDLKTWLYKPGDTVDTLIREDEPLGEFDPDVIREYTHREISIEAEYGLGDTRDGRREISGDDGDDRRGYMIQYIKIYEEGELICVCANGWNFHVADCHFGY